MRSRQLRATTGRWKDPQGLCALSAGLQRRETRQAGGGALPLAWERERGDSAWLRRREGSLAAARRLVVGMGEYVSECVCVCLCVMAARKGQGGAGLVARTAPAPAPAPVGVVND